MKKSVRVIPVILAVCLLIFIVPFGIIAKTDKTADAAASYNTVKITIPSEYKDMGGYSIRIKESSGNLVPVPKTQDDLYTFERGTVIQIKALPKAYYEVRDIKQIFPLSERNLEDKNIVEITVLTNREIVFLFQKEMLEYNEDKVVKKISNGTMDVKCDGMSIDSNIYVTVELDSIYEVKDFIVNGIAVNNSAYKGNIDYQNNLAVIHITEEWLLGHNENLEIEVTTKFKQVYFIIGLCAVVIVPLLLTFILLMIISNSRAKKTAAAALKGKLITAQRSNTGNFVKQLREGKFGAINKKSIKEEIKGALAEAAEEDIAAREIAQEHEAEVPPAPPKPTKQTYKLIELFEESALKQDKTFVKGGKVIARLQDDLTIVDKSGKVIATAKIKDGKLVDKDNNAVGIITADGVIKKVIVL